MRIGKKLYKAAKELVIEYEKEKTRLSKIANAHASRAKAKARGHSLGRKRRRDDQKIRKLHNKGFSIREIARQTLVSATTVQKSLKESKK